MLQRKWHVQFVFKSIDVQRMKLYPLLLMSNILNATEKFDSGILSSVTKKIYLLQSKP